ncbi:hypothetical protein AV530_000108 [Patagioenas fasciata monilis]|uniref:Uncharacterized protein n=1 Tax=Patagioenas fasciata monilis TaxID=372326 RepID=A0A1V4K097_PATFA|nr:hypothetical protein AV530_000108 [Patagioenas fasciata monilis]
MNDDGSNRCRKVRMLPGNSELLCSSHQNCNIIACPLARVGNIVFCVRQKKTTSDLLKKPRQCVSLKEKGEPSVPVPPRSLTATPTQLGPKEKHFTTIPEKMLHALQKVRFVLRVFIN